MSTMDQPTSPTSPMKRSTLVTLVARTREGFELMSHEDRAESVRLMIEAAGFEVEIIEYEDNPNEEA